MIRFFGFLLLTSLAAAAMASPSSPPPGASGAGVTSRPVVRQRLLDEDPRLEKPVTLRSPRPSLPAVVAELPRKTEVRMRASIHVADEPALLFVTDQPAREVMHQLA